MKDMNDLKPHKHGQEGTHYNCSKHAGKTCCACDPKEDCFWGESIEKTDGQNKPEEKRPLWDTTSTEDKQKYLNAFTHARMGKIEDLANKPEEKKIKHVTCHICGVYAVPHEHPKVDGTYDSDNKPKEEREWWERYGRIGMFQNTDMFLEVPVSLQKEEFYTTSIVREIVAEAEKRGALKAVEKCKEIVKKASDSAEYTTNEVFLEAELVFDGAVADLSAYKESLMKPL